MDPTRVLFAASECTGLVKTGGLGDVVAALPKALIDLGIDVRLLMPGYPPVLAALPRAEEVARISARAALPSAGILQSKLPSGVPIYVIDCPELYVRSGGPYQDDHHKDWTDNARRFALLGHVAATLASPATPLPWRVDVLHAHDWQAGLAPAYVALGGPGGAPTLLTIHNLAFQGLFERYWLELVGLPVASWSMYGVEYHGHLSFLKAGLYYADAISTVSPTYAREIQTAPLGMGLEGLLAGRSADLHGILNGIDDDAWNPREDPLIPARYSASSLWRKARNKRALQAKLALAPRDDVPLFGVVSRLTLQKGIDLVVDAADAIVAYPAQIAVLGAGDRGLEAALTGVVERHPTSVGLSLHFDEALAHLIEAGADAFLMPSRFEPCGMNQMYSQRYGTPPIVHTTGGLADSVVDCRAETLANGDATGFAFAQPTHDAMLDAIGRSITLWRDPPAWRHLQRNAMARDFGWAGPAAEYARLYASLARARA